MATCSGCNQVVREGTVSLKDRRSLNYVGQDGFREKLAPWLLQMPPVALTVPLLHVRLHISVIIEQLAAYIKGQTRCNGCGSVIDEDQVLINRNGVFHVHCHICKECYMPLGESAYKVHNGHGYCSRCATALPGVNRETCARCQQPFKEAYMTALDKSWHYDCFKCEQCQAPVSGGFVVISNAPHCADCANRRVNPQIRR
ncbi:actin-binding LIM protein 1 [Planoprotostelium fungivorum]|uniref:Actin-binding LIM protein 1 n=1 Tax=Planoprotostelium fungivorum TaxID=1890364 RepID=A0A2P6NHB9_9EUKA|nr:actin-binding LIM protein 1 [Planoprotostelium fungivorum]